MPQVRHYNLSALVCFCFFYIYQIIALIVINVFDCEINLQAVGKKISLFNVFYVKWGIALGLKINAYTL